MRFRVLTYNIHRAIGVDRRFRPERIIRIIESHQADIVFLQEVQGEHERHAGRYANWPGKPQHEFIAERLWTGASLIISDQGISNETGTYTDFIVLTR